MMHGHGVSGGVGIGRAFWIRPFQVPITRKVISDILYEHLRYQSAVKKFIAEITQDLQCAKDHLNENELDILAVQQALIDDPQLNQSINDKIKHDQVNAEYAVSEVCNDFIQQFASIEDPLIRSRVYDFRDMRNRLLRILLKLPKENLADIPEGSILVADNLMPSQAASINPRRIAGVLISEGSENSHAAIICRALGVPAVITSQDIIRTISPGDIVIIDGDSGLISQNPSPRKLDAYIERQHAPGYILSQRLQATREPVHTSDSYPIEIMATINSTSELISVVDSSADGIDMVCCSQQQNILDNPIIPEAEYLIYREIVQSMAGRSVSIQVISTQEALREKDAASRSGERHIRLHRLRAQLSGILRASALGRVQIVVPVVFSTQEVVDVRSLLEELMEDMEHKGISFDANISLGALIVTPTAALCIDNLVKYVDFLSVDIDVLTSCILSMGKEINKIGIRYSPFHPTVLRLLHNIVRQANDVEIPVYVGGEIAHDPLMLPVLVGAGIGRICMKVSKIPKARDQIAGLSRNDWKDEVASLLELNSAGLVADRITRYMDLQTYTVARK